MPPMTRDQICLERRQWDQSRTAAGQTRWNVWTPLGRLAERWAGWEFLRNPDEGTDGITAHNQGRCYDAIFREGAYFGSKVAEYTFPDGDWVQGTNAEFRYLHANASTNRLQLSVPAGTDRVYIFGYGQAGSGSATVSITGGVLDKASLDFGSGGDFSTTPDWTTNILQIAHDCGGETITITPDSTDHIRVVGFMAIKTAGSDPANGVFDPATLQTFSSQGQTSIGPLYLKFGAGGSPFWWGFGHTDATYTITGESETLTYGDAQTAWDLGVDPADDAWVRYITTSFFRRLSGTMAMGAGDKADQGTYTEHISATPSGVFVVQMAAFGANAASEDLRCTAGGGYTGQWALNARLDRGRALPYNGSPIPVPQGASYCQAADDLMALYGPDTVALFAAGGVAIGTGVSCEGECFIQHSAVAGSQFPKFYRRRFPVAVDLDVADGDTLIGFHNRVLTDRGGLEPALARR